jgi:hypothetical protein
MYAGPRAFFYLNAMEKKNPTNPIYKVSVPTKIAVLIDGGFFIKRYNALYNSDKSKSAKEVTEDIYTLRMYHRGNLHCSLNRFAVCGTVKQRQISGTGRMRPRYRTPTR